jgi:hypothetical protein
LTANVSAAYGIFGFSAALGIVPVLLQAMKEEPPLNGKCKDKFLIQSTIITPEKENMTLHELVGVSNICCSCTCVDVGLGSGITSTETTPRYTNRKSKSSICHPLVKLWKRRMKAM